MVGGDKGKADKHKTEVGGKGKGVKKGADDMGKPVGKKQSRRKGKKKKIKVQKTKRMVLKDNCIPMEKIITEDDRLNIK